MINTVETSPGAMSVAAAAGDPAARSGVQAAPAATETAGDRVAPGQAALLALAYVPPAVSGRVPGARWAQAASESETGDANATRFGPQYAFIRAALPSALQRQFDAQLAAYGGLVDEAGAQRRNLTFLPSDLAELLRGSASGKDAADATTLVSRLVQDVGRFGSATVAQGLQLAHERIAFAGGPGMVADSFAETRVLRREGEPRRQGRERRPERDARDEPSVTDDVPAYTIHDVVSYRGTAVATQRTPVSLVIDERNAT